MRILGRGSAMVAALTTMLLILAGRLSYWQAWLFGAVNCGMVVFVAVSLADQVDTIRARMKPAPDAKRWDKVIMAVFFPLTTSVIVIAGLDGGRFGWSGPLPALVYPPAYAVYVLSAYLHLWAIRANVHYTSTVSIRGDGSQQVSEGGPYRYVRHPGYTGIIFMEAGIATVLGSWAALVPAALVAVLLVIRTRLEDAALMEELPGYPAYAYRVRFKLIPGVW